MPRSRWFAVSAALVPLLATAVIYVTYTAGGGGPTAAHPATACAAQRRAAGSSVHTLLGVDATHPARLATVTAEFGHLPIIRVYYDGLPDPNLWTTGVQGINKSAVVVSFRVPPAAILSGVDDAALLHFFGTAPAGYPVYYSYYHEPELFISGGRFTLTAYKAAWAHIVALADAAHNPGLRSTLILTAWDLDPRSGVSWKDFLPSGRVISTLGWDAYPAGTVRDQNPRPTPPAGFMGPEVTASRSLGLPFGFAEFALATQAGRAEWLTEVARYLQRSGALFGTLFDPPGARWGELNDAASIEAWRNAVARAGHGAASPGLRCAP
ncbi:MAG: hypothetical protein JOY82_03985 [Streptosporangiaceae bacterium]|nr:hypothetical protein [Streptosporangiaceae bacterium]MBV9853672.1 hypothetical protein [Streptosporangiaceae bacterium]